MFYRLADIYVCMYVYVRLNWEDEGKDRYYSQLNTYVYVEKVCNLCKAPLNRLEKYK